MAYDIIAARGYGSAEQGDATNPATINHYASVSAIDTSAQTITVDDATNFTQGTEIMLHISGLRSADGNKAYLGRYKFAKIMSVAGNVLTLSVKPLNLTVEYYFYQAITVPHYKTLTISQTVEPPAFQNGVGGILVFKAHTLNMSGAINLVNKGLTADSQRPWLTHEEDGIRDTDKFAGYENYETAYNFTLQKGDGSCLIIAKEINFESTARIGNPNYSGTGRCRGADDSIGKNSELTNIGGSSILIVAPEIEGFSSYIISKYRKSSLSAGKGLARAYIATERMLTFDEGLYATDIISTPERLSKDTLIDGFGDGSTGAASSKDIQQNSYAFISTIYGSTYRLINIDQNGKAKFTPGTLVMIQALYKDTSDHVGRFFVDKIVDVKNDSNGNLKAIILNNNPQKLQIPKFDPTHYYFQAIAIPQYSSFSASNFKTPKYENHRGGVFAIAVNGTCDLSDKTIDVMRKGGSKYFSQITNASMKNRLPVGEGHGSVFILAKKLIVNTSTRIGATYSGNSFGGSESGYMGKRSLSASDIYDGYGGGGFRAGQQYYGHNGGYFSNATEIYLSGTGGHQGASIFIVAGEIDGLSLDCLSTGGAGGYGGSGSAAQITAGEAGGCGYGGSGAKNSYKGIFGGYGGVHGGGSGGSSRSGNLWVNGGGASGFCVIYANKATNQDTTNL
ncbi:MAG: hypothetical protein SR1Q5_00885 [Quinella sp. 1Q5]|nr:hypothetical protein [Quinella sp. 1Q5]